MKKMDRPVLAEESTMPECYECKKLKMELEISESCLKVAHDAWEAEHKRADRLAEILKAVLQGDDDARD